jgi:hypothetical protein
MVNNNDDVIKSTIMILHERGENCGCSGGESVKIFLIHGDNNGVSGGMHKDTGVSRSYRVVSALPLGDLGGRLWPQGKKAPKNTFKWKLL